MKNEIVVNGVTLTRAQVEQALKDLNTHTEKFQGGDIVYWSDCPDVAFVVMPREPRSEDYLAKYCIGQYGSVSIGQVRFTDGRVTFTTAEGNLELAPRR